MTLTIASRGIATIRNQIRIDNEYQVDIVAMVVKEGCYPRNNRGAHMVKHYGN